MNINTDSSEYQKFEDEFSSVFTDFPELSLSHLKKRHKQSKKIPCQRIYKLYLEFAQICLGKVRLEVVKEAVEPFLNYIPNYSPELGIQLLIHWQEKM